MRNKDESDEIYGMRCIGSPEEILVGFSRAVGNDFTAFHQGASHLGASYAEYRVGVGGWMRRVASAFTPWRMRNVWDRTRVLSRVEVEAQSANGGETAVFITGDLRGSRRRKVNAMLAAHSSSGGRRLNHPQQQLVHYWNDV